MILGLDISTSITGATVLDKDGKCVYNEYWDTRNKNHFPTIYHKAQHVKEHLEKLHSEHEFEHVFVEQSAVLSIRILQHKLYPLYLGSMVWYLGCAGACLVTNLKYSEQLPLESRLG